MRLREIHLLKSTITVFGFISFHGHKTLSLVDNVQYLLEISGLGPPLENNIIPWTPPPPTFESVHGLLFFFFFKEIFQEFIWTCRHQSKLLLYFSSLLYLHVYYFDFFVLLRSAMKSSYKKKLNSTQGNMMKPQSLY